MKTFGILLLTSFVLLAPAMIAQSKSHSIIRFESATGNDRIYVNGILITPGSTGQPNYYVIHPEEGTVHPVDPETGMVGRALRPSK